jgi:hypothetical protein
MQGQMHVHAPDLLVPIRFLFIFSFDFFHLGTPRFRTFFLSVTGRVQAGAF